MLGAILGAHSRCVTVPESLFMTEALAGSRDAGSRIRRILADDRFHEWELAHAGLERDLLALGADYAAVWRHLVRSYAAAAGRRDARVWVDHTPFHARLAVTLVGLFPHARFVHLVRDGRAIAASVVPLPWGPNTVEWAARWWIEFLAFGLGLEAWGGPRVMRVRYEDLVGNPNRTIPAVAAFAGLEYEPGMLRADGFRVPADPTGQHALVGQPLQPERAAMWEDHLTTRDVEIFESSAGDLLSYLGYASKFGGAARPPTAREHAAAAVRERLRTFVVNTWRFRRQRARRRAILGERAQRAAVDRTSSS